MLNYQEKGYAMSECSVCDPVLIVGIQKRSQISFPTATLINDNFVTTLTIGRNWRDFQLARVATITKLNLCDFEFNTLTPTVKLVVGSFLC